LAEPTRTAGQVSSRKGSGGKERIRVNSIISVGRHRRPKLRGRFYPKEIFSFKIKKSREAWTKKNRTPFRETKTKVLKKTGHTRGGEEGGGLESRPPSAKAPSAD